MAEDQDKASPPDLRGLENDYDIRGELRGTAGARYYIGSRRQDGAEVAITILRAPKDGGNNALSHFASDVQVLTDHRHPAIPRVIEGRWIGNDAFAVVTERVMGTTLGELLERGERFSSPRAAMLLQGVSGVLDWARENGIVNRGVTPESLWIENDSNGVRVSLVPAPVPVTGVSDAGGDARTIARLAWAILTGHPHADEETRSIGEVLPNLATRVANDTDAIIRGKDHVDEPDIGRYLGTLAAADTLKAAEVELAAQKEEFQEAHAREIRKCELQRQRVEQHAAEQLAILAGERDEFERAMSDERAATNAEREQMRSALAERQRHLAAVRAELDQQRTELERRLTELEQYRVEVEKVRDEALKAHEVATKVVRDAAREGDTANAGPAAELSKSRPKKSLPTKPQLSKPPKAPKWDKLKPVELEEGDIVVEEGGGGRPRWMIPAGLATLALILIAGIYGMTHRTQSASGLLKLGKATVVATQPGAPRAGEVQGFLTQPNGGRSQPQFNAPPGSGQRESTATVAPPVDSVAMEAARARQDSIGQAAAAAAAAARARRAEAAREKAQHEAEHRPAQVDTARQPVIQKPDPSPVPISLPHADSVRVDTVIRRDTSFQHLRPVDMGPPRPDTTARPRPDSLLHHR